MGDYNLEFERISDYKDELLRSNPGSTCVLKLHDETFEDGRKIFQGFYICVDAMKKSFLAGCRKCIGLDGCFLKEVTKGQLLVAVCKDGNNKCCHWHEQWIVKEDLQLGDRTDLTVIIDMQKGLEIAVTEYLPNVEHRMCARHVLANWSKDAICRGIEKKKYFWRCAKSTFEADLRDNIRHMKMLGGEEILDKLMYFNPERWSKILGARHKTIITMLEDIRVKMMKRVGQMRDFCETWISDISPMAMKMLNDNTTRSMKCNIEWNSDTGYEVLDRGYRHIVDLARQYCSCRAWMLKGIPCPHAVAALHHKKLEPITTSLTGTIEKLT
ncbi:uncharacterized protein LOC124899433 [Capsicum annuum]|uniref:uncharacterized protein LOC124899433 n=1 Tax=Capsicum annuum TaxID=4072 RepID=UPI001FB16EC2|nr:uncharacterized protein LOC124899433 [Capsicum annuum]